MEKKEITIETLTFEDVKLLRISGANLIGIEESRDSSTLKFKGVSCSEAPDKSKFVELFTALVTNEARTITVDNPRNTSTLDMNSTQRLAFAGAHAEFVVAMSMRESELTKIALKGLL